MDSLTSKNMNSVTISKIYKTESSVPLEPEVDMDFRDHSKHGSSVENISNGFPDLENMNSVNISKIYKTESSVPVEPEVDLDFSRSRKHGSLVEMSAMDSSTLKT